MLILSFVSDGCCLFSNKILFLFHQRCNFGLVVIVFMGFFLFVGRITVKLWCCNFNSQLANALIIEGDYHNSISALQCGFICAAQICYPELQVCVCAVSFRNYICLGPLQLSLHVFGVPRVFENQWFTNFPSKFSYWVSLVCESVMPYLCFCQTGTRTKEKKKKRKM